MPPFLRASLLVFTAVALLALPLDAEAVTVPGDYPTIQAAINAVVSGALPNGTVIDLAPGTYNEALYVDSTARSFVVRGTGGAGVTIINASGRGPTALRINRGSGSIRFEGLTFTGGNSATGNGGGLTVQDSSPAFVACVFRNNAGWDGGAGVIIRSNPTFQNVTFDSNTARRFGGALTIIEGSRPVFVGCTLQNNRSGTSDPIGSGGAVHANDASPVFHNSVIRGNSAKFAAGGIFHMGVYGSRYGVATLTVEDSVIDGNVVTRWGPGYNPGEGGGVHVEDNAVLYLRRSRVVGNRAETGGGLNSYRARIEVQGSIIEGNSALDPAGVGGFGGGIGATSNNGPLPFRPAAVVVVRDSVLRGNSADAGGAMLVGGDQQCGGGCAGPTDGNKATVEISDTLVLGNTAARSAGGINVAKGNLTVTRSYVLRNSVPFSGGASFGGGIAISSATSATVSATTIAGNSSLDYGGGLFVDVSASITVTGSVIAANSSTNGGGLYVGGNGPPSGRIQSSTIADNSGWQIFEQACGGTAPILYYQDNNVVATNGQLYRSTCTYQASTAAQLNALPSGRASGNYSTTPNWAAFVARPSSVAAPLSTAVLAWAIARPVGAISIAGVGSTTEAIGSANVVPGEYRLTANSAAGSVGPLVASVGTSTAWGVPSAGDVPEPADFDGDGRADLAVYRATTGEWLIWRSGGQGSFQFQWGAPALNDRPVPADFDGDGKADLAVYRQSSGHWLIWRSGGQGYYQYQWGAPALGDIPVPADYDGDGRTDLAVCRPGSGDWFIYGSRSGSQVVPWGCGAFQTPADYDGDRSAEIATWDGVWRIRP